MKPEPDDKPLRRWMCPNCGQFHFGHDDDLPDMCDYCNDLTTWRLIEDTHNTSQRAPQQISPIHKNERPG